MLMSPLSRTGFDPFAEMRRLQADMNQIFEHAGTSRPGRSYPPVNLWLGDNSVVVTAELAGLSSDDIDLTIAEGTLTIRGERPFVANDNEVAWHRRERPVGSFSRTVTLPFRVDAERIEARFKDGVLEVEMQRPEADLPRKISVNAS